MFKRVLNSGFFKFILVLFLLYLFIDMMSVAFKLLDKEFSKGLVGNLAGLTIAFVHLLFNIAGICLIYPVKRIRRIPI